MTVRLPMTKRKALVADNSGACQPAAPGATQSRASSSAASQPDAPDAEQSRASRTADSSGASQPVGPRKPADSLMQAIRTHGRLPKQSWLPPSSGSAKRIQPPDPEQQAQLAPFSSGEQKREILELIEQEAVIAAA